MDIEVESLGYAYKGQEILKDLTISFPKGSVSAILGPSGCGKSTFLNILAGLIPPSHGKILYQGHSLADFPVGYMTQKDLLLPFKTVFDNLLLICHLQEEVVQEGKTRVEKLLERFHLQDIRFKYPRELSGGLRQRVSLLRQLLVKSPLLLLDEPFVALDIVTKQGMETELFQIVQKEKQTAILVTHDIQEALACSHQLIILGHSPATVVKIFQNIPHKSDHSISEEILTLLHQTYSYKIGE